MSDIFHEIDEELRRENFAKLWQRYGVYVMTFAVLIVGVTAAIVLWRQHLGNVHRAESVRYAAALQLAQKNEQAKAAEAFSSIAREAGGGYGLLARFEAAALAAKASGDAAAVVAYDKIAADGDVEPTYRDLATVLGALHALPAADPKSVIAKLQPLATGGGPWQGLATEITALAHLKAGDKPAAIAAYKRLADNVAAPSAQRARAAEMIAALGD